MLAPVERAGGDLALQPDAVVECANITPADLVGVSVEGVVAYGFQMRRESTATLAAHQGIQGFVAVCSGAMSGHGCFPDQRFAAWPSGEGRFQIGADRPDCDVVDVEAIAVAGFQPLHHETFGGDLEQQRFNRAWPGAAQPRREAIYKTPRNGSDKLNHL